MMADTTSGNTPLVNTDVLNSWKEVATYMGRGVRTVQRWEQELGLPVRRPRGKSRSAVIALKPELDQWLARGPKQETIRKPLRKSLNAVTLHTNTAALASHSHQLAARSSVLCERSKLLCEQINRAIILNGRLKARKNSLTTMEPPLEPHALAS
jgi:phage terminase Nu1 subunit (DNA packaging protein)